MPRGAQPGRRGGTADQGPRRLHVVEEGGDQPFLRRLAVGEGVHVDVAAPLAQRLHLPLVLQACDLPHHEVLLVGRHELVGDVEGLAGGVGRDADVGGVRVHARQPLLVALGADQGGDRQQPAELPVVRAGELEHDVARGRAEEAQQPDLEPRAVRRVLEVVGDGAEVAGEARDRRVLAEEPLAGSP